MNILNLSLEFIILISINCALLLIIIISSLINRSRYKRLKIKYSKFMSGLSDRNLEEVIEQYMDKVNEISEKNKELEKHINYVERNILQCIQKIGVVRFNAFDDVGCELSFAISLLDSNDNGVVLNGIYSRDSSAVYTKPIVKGNSKYTLSAEEVQAIDIAKKTYLERLYNEKKQQ